MLGVFCVVCVCVCMCVEGGGGILFLLKCKPSMFPVFAWGCVLVVYCNWRWIASCPWYGCDFVCVCLHLPFVFVCVDCVNGCLYGCFHTVFELGGV